MPWQYSQRTGNLYRDTVWVGAGYSGAGWGRNNPELEEVRNLGPIPRGRYRIGAAHDTADHGPHVMALAPVLHNAHGRTGFLIHGDNSTHTASQGCIILGPHIRSQISESADTELEVTR